jgi:hypothetical protein
VKTNALSTKARVRRSNPATAASAILSLGAGPVAPS